MKNLPDAPLLGRLLVLPTNNRLGWKGLPGTKHSSPHRLSFMPIIVFLIDRQNVVAPLKDATKLEKPQPGNEISFPYLLRQVHADDYKEWEVQRPGVNSIKLFTSVIYDVCSKLQCLSLASLFSLV